MIMPSLAEQHVLPACVLKTHWLRRVLPAFSTRFVPTKLESLNPHFGIMSAYSEVFSDYNECWD
jgi:hypothetical protein